MHRTRLPSLIALKTFESAARLENFTQAAEELFVTQSAVSRQIRALEEDLGVTLFRRGHRRVQLTSEGRRLQPVLEDAFARIGDVVDRLRHSEREVRLKVPPTFGMRWLYPRLSGFRTTHPDIAVRLTTAFDEVKLGKEAFDLGVIYTRLSEPQRKGDRLVTERVAPVAAPFYLAQNPPIREPADLRGQTLLLNNQSAWDWRRWARTFDVEGLPLEDALETDLDEAAIQGAIAGQGVALVALDFISTELHEERLIRLFPEVPALPIGHFMAIYARGALDDRCVQIFRDWLLSQCDPVVGYTADQAVERRQLGSER